MERTLFDPPAVSHSPTSVKAAESVAGQRAATLRRQVLDYLRQRHPDGATDEEIQTGLGMDANTQRPRRVELVRLRQVRDSGRTRRTRSGRQAVVWEATA